MYWAKTDNYGEYKNIRKDINTNVDKMNLRNLGRTTNKK